MKKENDSYYNLLAFKIVTHDDEDAYYSLFNLFYSPLCIYAYRYIKDLQTREDCVQDVFLKLWRDRKKIDIATSVRSYLLSATKNRCLNYLSRKELELDYEQTLLKNYCDEEEIYSIAELESMIQTAIAQLPEKYRIVFEMNRFEELTYKEIAQKLDISVKTVESYISKTLAILRVKLREYYIFFAPFIG